MDRWAQGGSLSTSSRMKAPMTPEVTPRFISVSFPNPDPTYPFGLNDNRWIAGTYSDSAGVHGFIAKPNF